MQLYIKNENIKWEKMEWNSTSWWDLKGTLMQVWKSPYIFAII